MFVLYSRRSVRESFELVQTLRAVFTEEDFGRLRRLRGGVLVAPQRATPASYGWLPRLPRLLAAPRTRDE